MKDRSAIFGGVWRMLALAACWFLGLGLGGCTESPERVAAVQPTDEPVRLVLYNWEEYLGRDTLDRFRRATGIEVELRTYEDDEEMVGALLSGSLEADLIILSESAASELVWGRVLAPLNRELLPNLRHVDPGIMAKLQIMGEDYKAPYLEGYTGVVVNTRHVDRSPDSWSVLWEPSLAGRVAMLNNPFEVIGAASLLLGYPLNPEPEHLDEVRDALLEQRPLLAGYLHDTEILNKMASGELWAAQSYSSDALMAMEENPDLAFGFPQEGCAAWVDVFVVPVLARNADAAHAFINFVHTPEIMAEIAGELWSATPNLAAREFIDPEVLESPVVHPPQSVRDRCTYFDDFGSSESVSSQMKLFVIPCEHDQDGLRPWDESEIEAAGKIAFSSKSFVEDGEDDTKG